MATSKDVARLAGVSQGTVSRVFNGSSLISPATSARVRSVATDLGYEPDLVAQSLVRQRSRTVALGLFPDEADGSLAFDVPSPFYLDILRHIERAAAQTGYDLLLPSRAYRGPRDYVRSLRMRHVAGAVLLALSVADPRIQELIREDIPTVFVDVAAEGPRATHVRSDNLLGAQQVMEHLLALGHRRVAILSGHAASLAGTERLLGYQQALGRAGAPIVPGLVRQSTFTMENAYDDTLALLDERRDFTALIASSDLMAIGALRALHERNVRVPEDVSVAGFDDIDLCLYVDPPLTTVRQDRAAIAVGAFRRLIAMIEDQGTPDLTPLIIPTQLVVRASTGPISSRGAEPAGPDIAQHHAHHYGTHASGRKEDAPATDAGK
jgi:DNA-binding LacI/PurR family transcriptional regulator